MTIQAALIKGTQMLREAGIDEPGRDARKLMSAALGIETGRLTLRLHDPFEDIAEAAFFADILERCDGKPVSHLLGYRDFYGRRFQISPSVLDPRPETETLIEAALKEPFSEVLDLGSGSGCILLTLLAERPNTTGIGVDISRDSFWVAEANAKALGVDQRCALIESDWFDLVGGQFDLIVSNPPYIAADEMAGLSIELTHEPRIALTDEGDGLGAYHKIAAGVMDHLAPGGRLLVEIGPTQAAAVSALLEAAGLSDIRVLPDLDGRDRVVAARAP